MHNVLILTDSHLNPSKQELEQLLALDPKTHIKIREDNNYTEKEIETADIILGSPQLKDLNKAKALKWLQLQSAGCFNYADKNLYKNPVILSNASGSYGLIISEHVMGFILTFNHHFQTYQNQQRAHVWKSYFNNKDLANSTALIIGFGDLGQQIAKKTKSFGMKNLVIKRTISEKPNYVDEMSTIASLKDFIPSADYIVLATPLTPETIGFFDKTCISLMKKDSYFINIARGALVDEKALIEALQNNNISGAGLDVTINEPLEQNSPLWDLDNVILTPHASGLSHEDTHLVFKIFIENFE